MTKQSEWKLASVLPPWAGVMVLMLGLVFTNSAWAASKRILYSFRGGDGAYPVSSLVLDAAGNVYGTTSAGGTGTGCDGNCGTVFELTSSSGVWTENTIYDFSNDGSDAYRPSVGVVFDSVRNLYGTTSNSGANGCGVIYQLVPSGGGWTENTLHRFAGGSNDGCIPHALTFNPETGNLYGATQSGGPSTGGVVFELTPGLGGGWNYAVIYYFQNNAPDGLAPLSSLTLDGSGNLYGTTNGGGVYGFGTVFKLTPTDSGWTETIIYNFTSGHDGAGPQSPVIFGPDGNLYGSTAQWGANNVGILYMLTPTKGYWTIHVIHTFTGGWDGAYPTPSGLITDSAGSLYGTTSLGGIYNYGTAFKVVKAGSRWKETVLHAFTNKRDGEYPFGGLVFDSAGNLYGSAGQGGAGGYGIVFEGTP